MKKRIDHLLKGLSLYLVFVVSLFSLASAEQKPQTVAESSHFKATSLYSDVIIFIQELQSQSSMIRVEKLCISPEGRDVPLLVIGNPVPSSPLDLKYDKRAVVYIQANLHAGEVEGKEAALMLARDIVLKDTPPYLDNLVVLIAPLFNADGNEKISPTNRRNQAGPEKGVGVRYNGQNLDLNRDSMKLESPELQGLLQNILMRWDPVLLVDCHTTNGSYHEEPVTYSWSLNPNGDSSIIKYMRDNMLPSINENLHDKYNTLSVPYGNFMDSRNPEKGWRTFGPQPRYVTNYIGLRNRLAILNENYSYADFKTRVLGCYNLLNSILEYCHSHKDEIIQLVKKADFKTIQRGLNPSENDTFTIETELKPLEKPVSVRGWEMEILQQESGRPRVKKTDKKKTFTMPYYANFVPNRTVPIPFAYLTTLSDSTIITKLQQHGIVIERLTQPATLEVQVFQVNEIKGAERLYQGHRMNSVKGEYALEKRDFPKGTLLINTAQPLSNVISYLLEPESDDGLVVWNFFDRYLVPQWRRTPQTYPVYKLLKPVNLIKETIPYNR